MKLIVGLGNPGDKFKSTRHNLGFMVVDALVASEGLSWRYSQDLMGYFIKTSEYVLAKPSIYMNRSGETVRHMSNFYKIEPKDILAVHDDLDLDFGKIRLSFDSTSAGHKGVESLIEGLGGFDFARLRIGIGHPSRNAPADDKSLVGKSDGEPSSAEKYVLEDFNEGEQSELSLVIEKAISAVESYIDIGIEATMNKFN